MTAFCRSICLGFITKAMSDKGSRRDKITGLWSSRQFSRNGVGYVTTTLRPKGYGPVSETRRANSIWGDIENIRKGRGGHTYADLYDGRRQIATMKLHRDFSFYKDYGSYLDGRFKLGLRSERMTLWDSDLSNHWVAKAQYYNVF